MHKRAEEGKVAIRGVRHKSVDQLKALLKDHKITEDENKRGADQLQKLTDKYIKDVDALVHSKEGNHGGMTSDLVLLREIEARAALGDRSVYERILQPPYPALGLGRLRVLRVMQRDDWVELVCGYEGYGSRLS